MEHEPHDPRAIANRFLVLARRGGEQLTLMQLIKLVYLAHGWSLAIVGRPLSATLPQAWQYGPVFPQVYKAFKKFGSAPITELAIDKVTGRDFSADFDDDEKRIIQSVYDSYGSMHAFRLSDIMHREGTPWTNTYKSSGQYSAIPNAIISEHFKDLKEQRKVG